MSFWPQGCNISVIYAVFKGVRERFYMSYRKLWLGIDAILFIAPVVLLLSGCGQPVNFKYGSTDPNVGYITGGGDYTNLPPLPPGSNGGYPIPTPSATYTPDTRPTPQTVPVNGVGYNALATVTVVTG